MSVPVTPMTSSGCTPHPRGATSTIKVSDHYAKISVGMRNFRYFLNCFRAALRAR